MCLVSWFGFVVAQNSFAFFICILEQSNMFNDILLIHIAGQFLSIYGLPTASDSNTKFTGHDCLTVFVNWINLY